ncbi:myb family transcription factor PHL8-like isoform X2 [Telopea speciosissima]|uniref:myb family transcription factor PHL8-like isoform X2 n=1 Tax=Telopea speciosissima TaxID=54955 RepID=UPI001CC3A162|nr:myb family transcription factor PHL8-like isoform X2 [Telopea speciosissima]
MGLQITQNQDVGLVLSTDAKPRLKWTPELHQRFKAAVTQLGGADKATPKALMRVMGIPGLTLYHLKSHLQKYRLGKNQQSETSSDNNQEDMAEVDCREDEIGGGWTSGEIIGRNSNQMNESLQIAQALKIQMEVQKKLHEQMEVQRHLQLRIEAQGKYLQSVLTKAQETLAGYSSSMGIEAAKAELSQLVSMVDSRRSSPPLSELTETCGLSSQNLRKRPMRCIDCSMDSSLTSSGSSARKDGKAQNVGDGDIPGSIEPSVLLPLASTEMNPDGCNTRDTRSSDHLVDQKGSGSTFSDGNCVGQAASQRSPTHKERSGNGLREFRLAKELDLNSLYQSEMDSSCHELDLNCKEPDPSHL